MSKVRVIFFLVLIGAFNPITGARADDPAGGYLYGTEITCPGIELSEATRVKCNTIAYINADKELNALYSDLMSSADSSQRELLKKMQRAWVELKTAQCEFIGYYYRTVSSEKWKTACEAVMTIRRVQELKTLGTGIKW